MEEECFQAILNSQEEDNFKKLNTVWIVSIPFWLGVSLEICGIIFVTIWPEEQNKCDTYFIYLYLHCAFWLIVMMVDHVVKAKHHDLYINGYLEFYQSTYQLLRTPLFITSLWNNSYLLLAVILHYTHKVDYEEYCRSSEWFTPLNYIFLLTTLELAIILPAYVKYIQKVMKFNRLRPPADVTRDEWLSPFTQDSYSGMGEIGYRQRGTNLEELLEKQADFIRYLKAHNIMLNQKIEFFVNLLRALRRETL